MVGRIGSETETYAQALLAEVEQHAAVEGEEAFLEEAFTDLILDSLEEEGYWPDYQLAHLSQHGIGLSAWGLDPLARVLYLCITDFVYANAGERLSKADRSAAVKRLQNFFKKATSGTLPLQEHNPVVEVAEIIRAAEAFDSVRCTILSNRVATDNRVEESGGDIPVQVRVWDLETIRRSRTSGETLEPIEIDIDGRLGFGLPCLLSPKVHSDVKILLAFLPAQLLADIYLEFGPRLLERNVRSFLMARAKVNQGLRDTLREEPERFLAYNNGLTATAASVTIREGKDGRPCIARIEDLQIVNGGQTTASIAIAARDKNVDIKDVQVQMKLAVVSAKLLDELVPNISKFANRQNAVQDSDLASNHDFLRELEQRSRTEWTPAEATGRPSKWYFERARGSYAVDKSQSGSLADQARFVAAYPVNQRFGKNEIALYENTWARLPHLVSRGGQKNFAEFLLRLDQANELLDGLVPASGRSIFRHLVAKAILFKAADRVVNRNLGGTYKRSVVTYSMAYLIEHLVGQIDLGRLWERQQASPDIEMALEQVAEPVKDFLIQSAGGRNITEWAKSEACWSLLRAQSFKFTPCTASLLNPILLGDDQIIAAKRGQSGEILSNTGRQTLAECISRNHGEPLPGAWRIYRRACWFHLGETEIPTLAGSGFLDLYGADIADRDRATFRQVVAVDYPAGRITKLEELPEHLRLKVDGWLERLDP